MSDMDMAWAEESDRADDLEEELEEARALIAEMLAALQAQEAADQANEERLGYEKWQKLESEAKALRVAAIAKAVRP